MTPLVSNDSTLASAGAVLGLLHLWGQVGHNFSWGPRNYIIMLNQPQLSRYQHTE